MNLKDESAPRFLEWLDQCVLFAGRGDELEELEVEPSGRLWLGRLAPEEAVIALGLGDRGERLDPCAVGMVLQPNGDAPWSLDIDVSCRVWIRHEARQWQKAPPVAARFSAVVHEHGESVHGRNEISNALADATGDQGLAGEVRIEALRRRDGLSELSVSLVNVSPDRHEQFADTNLYECRLEVSGLETTPFHLASLPDSFRYDRRIAAYGINCGVQEVGGILSTCDTVVVDRGRPVYWNVEDPEPDLRFEALARDPIPSIEALVESHGRWGTGAWSSAELDRRAARDLWTDAMRNQADEAREEFELEHGRLREGIELLKSDRELAHAFRLMNEAMAHSAAGKYDSWRPFQLGFLLANLNCIVNPQLEAQTADIVWFATGGGKTETYLGLLVTAALHDRLTGKLAGITAWSRFPLRMLSLQQTQRFADALGAAELVRRKYGLPGQPLSLGFLVGQSSTPNQIKTDPNDYEPDPSDDEMPRRYQVLSQCPFCHGDRIEMGFDRRCWRLEHRCSSEDCPWPERALPFFIVDQEIYRFLPTVIVGTLDKAASIALQAAMRGLVGPPLGKCTGDNHGYLYAPRSKRPSGCLVPDCRFPAGPLEQPGSRFAPSFRLQDELHLLKDSLGAVDAHYEALLDHLQDQLSGRVPKILASSATLTGYDKQVDVLYNRSARVFPQQGLSDTEGFWSTESERLARRFVAVAPRGVTLEYAVDRTLTELQRAVRRLASEPENVCEEAGVPVEHAAALLSFYGTTVVYGNTLRDLDAATRSLETQIQVDGPLNSATLTGRTGFEEVSRVLERLKTPEAQFGDRIHVIAASSMMSHGVDVDRLNAMIVLGLPLTTAEFIQSTARVGRAWPGLVYVMHKIARERDAGVYRSFSPFVRQGDRFVEAVPVTRRSRRVLEKTIAGMQLARIMAIHEPDSGESLATVRALRVYFEEAGVNAEAEGDALIDALGLDGPLDQAMREDLKDWTQQFFRNLFDPAGTFTWPKDLCPRGEPMRSLRDVEEQVPILGTTR